MKLLRKIGDYLFMLKKCFLLVAILVVILVVFYKSKPIDVGDNNDVTSFDVSINGIKTDIQGTYYLKNEDKDQFVELLNNIRARRCPSEGGYGNLKVLIRIYAKENASSGKHAFVYIVDNVITLDESAKVCYKMDDESYERYLKFLYELKSKK